MNPEGNGRDQRGWLNFCARCGQRYWVRAADQHIVPMPRYTDASCQERHVCAKVEELTSPT